MKTRPSVRVSLDVHILCSPGGGFLLPLRALAQETVLSVSCLSKTDQGYRLMDGELNHTARAHVTRSPSHMSILAPNTLKLRRYWPPYIIRSSHVPDIGPIWSGPSVLDQASDEPGDCTPGSCGTNHGSQYHVCITRPQDTTRPLLSRRRAGTRRISAIRTQIPPLRMWHWPMRP